LWPNVSVSESWLRAECRFIDFGLAGPNCLGADLHHFAGRAAVGIDKEMFDGLVVTFSKQAAASEYDVRFGARFYALQRVVSRMAYHACRGQRKRLRRDRATFAALLALLQ
jgi:hypothetical protein